MSELLLGVGGTGGLQLEWLALSSGKCHFLAGGTKAAATTRDMILAQPIDIEELAKLGGWDGLAAWQMGWSVEHASWDCSCWVW